MFVNQSWMCFFVWTAWFIWFLDSVIVLEKSDVKTGHLTFKGGWAGWILTKICVAKGEVVYLKKYHQNPVLHVVFCLGPVVKNQCKGIISKAQWSNSCFLIAFRDSKVAPTIFVLVESSQGLHLCAVLIKNYGSTAATPKPCAILKHLFSRDCHHWYPQKIHGGSTPSWSCDWQLSWKKHMELRCSNELFSERQEHVLLNLKTQSCLYRKVFHFFSIIWSNLKSYELFENLCFTS